MSEAVILIALGAGLAWLVLRRVPLRFVWPLGDREDVLQYLSRRRANAETAARWASEASSEFAIYRDRVRQLDIMIEEIKGGLHEGEAEVQAQLGVGA